MKLLYDSMNELKTKNWTKTYGKENILKYMLLKPDNLGQLIIFQFVSPTWNY